MSDWQIHPDLICGRSMRQAQRITNPRNTLWKPTVESGVIVAEGVLVESGEMTVVGVAVVVLVRVGV